MKGVIMSKYYAVRVGREPGIYESWDECKEQIYKFKGAVYASFETHEEAENFINEELNDLNNINIDDISTYAFVDGSFNSKTNVYGCGGFLIHKEEDEEKTTIQASGTDPELATMRNIAGELLGSTVAIEKAIELGYKELTIFYDYAGIENWAKGLWKRNKKGTQAYYEFCQSVSDKIELHFVKVKGHTGIPGNEEADILAKQAVGLMGPDDLNEE